MNENDTLHQMLNDKINEIDMLRNHNHSLEKRLYELAVSVNNFEEVSTKKSFTDTFETEKKNNELTLENMKLIGVNKKLTEDVQSLKEKLKEFESPEYKNSSFSETVINEKLENLTKKNRDLSNLVREKQKEIDGLKNTSVSDMRLSLSDNMARFTLNSNRGDNSENIEEMKNEIAKLTKIQEENATTIQYYENAIAEMKKAHAKELNDLKIECQKAAKSQVEQTLKVIVKKIAEDNASRDRMYEEKIKSLEQRLAQKSTDNLAAVSSIVSSFGPNNTPTNFIPYPHISNDVSVKKTIR